MYCCCMDLWSHITVEEGFSSQISSKLSLIHVGYDLTSCHKVADSDDSYLIEEEKQKVHWSHPNDSFKDLHGPYSILKRF